MNKGIAFLTGIGVGGGLMFMLDPANGRRRRALVRDKAVGTWNDTADAVRKTSRDISNRAQGLAHMASAVVSRGEQATGQKLVDRVRSKIGRVVSHPRPLEITADGGRITVSGPVLAGEVEDLMKAIRGVPGVQEVENRLDVRESAENVPALQGGQELRTRTA